MSFNFVPVNMADPRLPKTATRYRMFIDGQWTDGSAESTFVRNSPAHGIPVSEYPRGGKADVENAVSAARRAFDSGVWSRISGAERAAVLLKAANLIRENAEQLALVETLETGKSIQQSRGEVLGAAGCWEYAAGMARAIHGESFNNLGDSMLGLVTREPVGVVGVITPWNFPFFIASERYPFVLASGCTIVAKAAEITSGTTLMMAGLLKEAGLPDGAFNVVTGPGSVIGQALTEHPAVDMVSFTGSTAVGQSTIAASAANIKKLGLELGGKNPQVVFADADIDAALDGTLFGLLFNGGQCCVSGSRLIVERSIHAEFCERLLERAAKVKIGDPLNDETQVGAIIDERQYATIMRYIGLGRDEGGRLLTGGEALGEKPGLFIQPTIFDGVDADMSIFREEIFGPVLCVTPFDTYDEAIRIANDSCFGLAASVWTSNLDNAIRGFRDLKAGRLWVNTTISGGPELPVGGCKESGYGRETGTYGLDEYTEVKAVHIHLGKRAKWLAD
ncbi:aldehyde dehydrogenase [Marinobacterium nitratireducens]|uniref:Aldehyde dehydrogenase n=1 Tax=Marinobacterium nitratireducens TaxID=518897 RepID=A0A917ZID8_9GAMM|nr:aldehyde dehydrogenase family protein [Marinobacterium nitratireducens]GGO83904.1 aldehyde dehydrogenase [Marinobacterium nitratireducens]